MKNSIAVPVEDLRSSPGPTTHQLPAVEVEGESEAGSTCGALHEQLDQLDQLDQQGMRSTAEPEVAVTSKPAPVEGVQAESVLEIDDSDDAGFSYGDDDSNSAVSVSIASSVISYEYADGRRYMVINGASISFPTINRAGSPRSAPPCLSSLERWETPARPSDQTPQKALDIGTGTGIWALDFVDQYPSCEVIGLDLSPSQPTWVPPNIKFYVDDVEKDWTYGPDDAFNVIHAWQMGEPETLVTSDDDTASKATASNEFLALSNKAADQFGTELNMGRKCKQCLIDAGFVDVKDEIFKTPIGPWAKDPKLKEVGRYFLEHCLLGVDAYILRFTGKVLDSSCCEGQSGTT